MQRGLIKTNLQEFVKEFKALNYTRIKASQTAVKMEAFRLRKLLIAEIKAGSPGGTALKELTTIGENRLLIERQKFLDRARKQNQRARESKRRRATGAIKASRWYHMAQRVDVANRKTPLYAFNRAILYRTKYDGGIFNMQIGAFKHEWEKTLKKVQQGSSVQIQETYRKKLIQFGAQLKDMNSRSAPFIYFFLKKTTASFNVPARNIIDAFMEGHSPEIMPNIQRNYEAKLQNPNRRI